MDASVFVIILIAAALVGLGVYVQQRSRPGAGGRSGPPGPRGSGHAGYLAPPGHPSVPRGSSRVRIRPPRGARSGSTGIQVGRRTEGCPCCGVALAPGEPYARCTAGHPHHQDCRATLDHCAMPHCPAGFA
jgi:hypothetical protein